MCFLDYHSNLQPPSLPHLPSLKFILHRAAKETGTTLKLPSTGFLLHLKSNFKLWFSRPYLLHELHIHMLSSSPTDPRHTSLLLVLQTGQACFLLRGRFAYIFSLWDTYHQLLPFSLFFHHFRSQPKCYRLLEIFTCLTSPPPALSITLYCRIFLS